MGTAIVNDDGAISVIPLDKPAIKEYPVTVMMIIMIVVMTVMMVVMIVILIMVPILMTLVGIVSDINDVPWKIPGPND